MIGRLSVRLPRAVLGISRIAGGAIAGQGLVMLSYPLLTRLYDTAEFGLLTVFTSVITMIAVVSTGTLDRAIPIPPSDQEAADLAWTALAAVTVTAALTAVVGLVAALPIATLLGVPRLADYWWLVALTVLAVGAYLVLSAWMVRDRSYGALGLRNLLQGVGQTGTQVGLGLLQIQPVGLLLGLGAGRLCGLGGLLSRRGLLRQRRPRPAELRGALRRYRRFPQLSLPSVLLNSAGLEVPLLLISAFYGDARAGLLGLTVRVFSAPTVFLGQAVDQVFTGESSAAIRNPQGRLTALLRYTAGRLLLVGALPTAVLAATGPWLFGVVFGPAWSEAGEYAQFLAFAYLAQFVVNPVSGVLPLLERQGLSLIWSSSRLILTVGGTAVCGLMGAPILFAIAALSIGHVVSYLLMYAICLHAARAADEQHRRDSG